MILVDTSAWIDFFRGRAPFAAAVDEFLAGNDVALCGPILTELRRGLKPSERKRVIPLLDGCTTLAQPASLWEEAGDLGFFLARRGVTVKSMDLLIATYALVHSVGVLTKDDGFADMRRAGVGLILVPP